MGYVRKELNSVVNWAQSLQFYPDALRGIESEVVSREFNAKLEIIPELAMIN